MNMNSEVSIIITHSESWFCLGICWVSQNGCESRLNNQVLGEADGDGMREMSAQSLIQGVQVIRTDLIEYRTTFKGSFPNNFDLHQVAASMYYQLVSHQETENSCHLTYDGHRITLVWICRPHRRKCYS